MNEVEKMLRKKKLEIDQLEVPDELEVRLQRALEKRPSPLTIMSRWKIKAVVLLFALILTGYNVDTLAFYGKKLVGYDQIMSGTLKQLNELGKGQVIGKSYTFNNGVSITLDGIMLDDNQLLAFYTVKDPRGKVDEVDSASFMSMKGILGEHNQQSGRGKMNEEKTEIKWVTEFETPYFFEKKLSWSFALREEGKREPGEIIFTIDRNKAMGHTLKKELNETIEVDETKIRMESILASPTVTVIKGTMQNIMELAQDQISGERFRPESLDIKLIANGKELSELGGGMSTDMKGITFDKEYDVLPTDLEKLQIQLVSFGADHDVNKQVELKKDSQSKAVKILGQNIEINRVYESQGETYVTITTEESVVLSRVYLLMDGNRVNLEETITGELDKMPDGVITHTRTLRFIGTGRMLQLDIQRLKYNKTYNQIIDIPIN